MVALAAALAGAGFAMWRGSIRASVAELHDLLESELADAEEHRQRAKAIIAASAKLGILGAGWSRAAHERVCDLCDYSVPPSLPRFHSCLASIRAALRCQRRGFV
jgi:hypothetical protein